MISREGKMSPLNKQAVETEEIWRMPQGVRNRYFSNKFFEKQSKKVNNRPAPSETID